MKNSQIYTELAPVALFAYSRPEHLSATLSALCANPLASRTDLLVFCDAPRNAAAKGGCEAVRSLLFGLEGFASVKVTERPVNFGLARSIIDGVTSVLELHEKVIVLEDDIVVSPYFLQYMNEALSIYSQDDCIASVHGYTYPVTESLPETFFLRGADCWGWATWRRAWKHFRPDGSALLAELESRGLVHEFDMDDQYGFTRMLRDQIAGRNNSWAIRWHASCFLDGRLTLYPGRSLVNNIGNDNSGTHCDHRDDYQQKISMIPVQVERLPLLVNTSARLAFVRFFRQSRKGLTFRAYRALRRLLGIKE
jgi:hypothetical protein